MLRCGDGGRCQASCGLLLLTSIIIRCVYFNEFLRTEYLERLNMRSERNVELLDIIEKLLDVVLDDGSAQDQRWRWELCRWESDEGFVGLEREIHFVTRL